MRSALSLELNHTGGEQDGDATGSSSWTCPSGEVCEMTYDLQAVESLEQLRIGEKHSTPPTDHGST